MKIYTSSFRNHYRVNIDGNPEWLDGILQSIVNFFWNCWWVKTKINYVKIDKYDTWSMDVTLAPIILPMLKQLKKTKQGAPFVDDEDVPSRLRSSNAVEKSIVEDGGIDSSWFDRWDWVMDQMIFSFEHIIDDSWEDQFYVGVYDKKGMEKMQEEIQFGLTLFGKHFRNLWD